MRKRGCLVVGLVVGMLCLTTSPAVADGHCKKQHAKIWNMTESFQDPELCYPYEMCRFFEIVGTLNGTGSWSRMAYWVAFPTDFTVVIWADMKVETSKGELWLEERCIVHVGANAPACSNFIWGGTGDYADATGWLSDMPDFPEGTRLVHGEICTTSE